MVIPTAVLMFLSNFLRIRICRGLEFVEDVQRRTGEGSYQ